jgi:hypothetical protein
MVRFPSTDESTSQSYLAPLNSSSKFRGIDELRLRVFFCATFQPFTLECLSLTARREDMDVRLSWTTCDPVDNCETIGGERMANWSDQHWSVVRPYCYQLNHRTENQILNLPIALTLYRWSSHLCIVALLIWVHDQKVEAHPESKKAFLTIERNDWAREMTSWSSLQKPFRLVTIVSREIDFTCNRYFRMCSWFGITFIVTFDLWIGLFIVLSIHSFTALNETFFNRRRRSVKTGRWRTIKEKSQSALSSPL